MPDDIALLQRMGFSLDTKIASRQRGKSISRPAVTVRDFLISSILKVRSKARGLVWLWPNRAQQEFSRSCTDRNIVLKARQMGITTYVAARFFIQTIPARAR